MKKKKHSQITYHRGVNAENIAAFWLQLKGYKILERRYKTSLGEIDLIAAKGNVISFIEVKARKNISEALHSITPHMKRRIENAALYYISHHKIAAMELRFDVIAVQSFKLQNIMKREFFIHHLDNAWQRAA